jgi:hypothetical protein
MIIYMTLLFSLVFWTSSLFIRASILVSSYRQSHTLTPSLEMTKKCTMSCLISCLIELYNFLICAYEKNIMTCMITIACIVIVELSHEVVVFLVFSSLSPPHHDKFYVPLYGTGPWSLKPHLHITCMHVQVSGALEFHGSCRNIVIVHRRNKILGQFFHRSTSTRKSCYNRPWPCSFGLSATSQQYFSLRTN